mgnify:FL=1
MIFVCGMMFMFLPIETAWEWFREGHISTADLIFSGILPVLLLIPLLRVTKVGWYTLVMLI